MAESRWTPLLAEIPLPARMVIRRLLIRVLLRVPATRQSGLRLLAWQIWDEAQQQVLGRRPHGNGPF